MDANQQEKGIKLVDINKEMRDAYLQYSMSAMV
jgi:DNA gyrase/topoisomerase IV subunit A